MKELANRLISIVDDDESIREAMTSLLKSSGFRTASFSSGEEFLASPCLNETACAILDVRMPGMGGLELHRRLAAEHAGVPVIFVTAHGTQEMRNAALRAGAVDLLTKPFAEEALLQAIHFALQSASGR